MTVLSWSLERKIKSAVGKNFKVHLKVNQVGSNSIVFKNQNRVRDEFSLFYEVLTEYEILKVANILAEVYSNFPTNASRNIARSSVMRLDLNSNTEASSEFVGAIIDMDSSALNRLFLLTSGNRLLSEDNLDLVLTLARMKKEAIIRPEDMSNFYDEYTTNHILPGFSYHILPGFSARTVIGILPHQIAGIENDGLEEALRVMAFLANNSTNTTLGEHLKLELSEAVKTRKSLPDFRNFKTTRRILNSHYRELAESMVASELRSLSAILEDEEALGKYPNEILRGRSSAMVSDTVPVSRYATDSLIRYLSVEEKRSLSSLTFVEHVNRLLTSSSSENRTPPIIFAAIAEVFAVKGERKALEVARELEHIRIARVRSIEFYEATVGLINLALEAETEDFPFSWTMQLSEHAWVLTSHLSDGKLSA